MLPDFPKAKQKLYDKLMDRFKDRVWGTGPFSKIQTKPIYEGDRFRIERADGTVQEETLKEHAVEMRTSPKEIEQVTPEQVMKKFDDAANEMSKAVSDTFYQGFEKITQETGNVVDAKGKPFTIEQYLEVLEKIEIDFTPDGRPLMPTLVANPKLLERARKVFAEAEGNPDYRNRFNEIIDRKRQSYRARESARKLVG